MNIREPVRMQLMDGITAQADWQDQMSKSFWAFGYIDDECAESGLGESYQPCMLGGQEPLETIFKGIVRYELPLPLDTKDRQAFLDWQADML